MPGRKLALLALLLFACDRAAPARPPNVVLISIDTLRSDHLPAYGYRAIATPALDRLSRDGLLFENAFSNVPLTLPSHTTIMTGLLPPEHGVRDNAGYRLSRDTPTIASLLHAHGYATGAAVSAYVLRRDSNLSSGFDVFDDGIDFVEGAPTGNLQRDGRTSATIVKQWITTHHTQPFFAFLHLFEPHTPYEPSYDAEIVKADAIVGDLLDDLRSQGLYDDTLIIVLSDHGEGLGDHEEQEHGVLLYREALQVPLIVKLPHSRRAGERLAGPAQLVDVLPTIASIAGIAVPAGVRGQSLLAPLQERAIYSETLYPRIHLGWSDLRSVVKLPLHLISGPRPELFDLSRDRRERVDLRATRRRESAQLDRELGTFPQTLATAPRVDAEERRKLAALGYVDAGGAVAASNVNPRDHLPDLEQLKEVTTLLRQGRDADAARLIEQLLERNPRWSDLRNDLGLAYERLGDLARAEKTYRDGIRQTPELASEFALSLSAILAQERKFDEASAHAKVALATNPAGAHDVLARIAFARHDFPGAQREADAMRDSPAHRLTADVLTAEILAAQGRRADALALLQQVASEAAARRVAVPPRTWFLTGDLLASAGRAIEAQAAFERAIAQDPRDREAYVALAFLSAAGGDRNAAETTLTRMTSAIPESRAEADDIRHELARH